MAKRISEKQKNIISIAVVGGGASGMIAAIAAARFGAKVMLFEKQKDLGRKLLATGNGQCNISNSAAETEYYHGANPRFAGNVLSKFSVDSTIDFFKRLGLALREDEKGRMYPYSLQARTVLEVLREELLKQKVDIKLHRRVDSILINKNNSFTLITAGKEKYVFDKVIFAPGGCSYSSLGGSKRGYELAAKIGHSVSSLYPSILPINIPSKRIHALEGIKWDVELIAYSVFKTKQKEIARSRGELLFTKYGLSGPVALDISGVVNREVIKNRSVEISIDLFPEYTEDELVLFLSSYDNGVTTRCLLNKILKYRMADVFLYYSDSMELADKPFKNLSATDYSTLSSILKSLKLEAGEPRALDEATVTAGGVLVDELDPQTMESKLVPGLYMCGELLDIDGACGGFNLQFAWSSGYLAGASAAE